MKKIFSIIFAVILLFAAGCDSNNGQTDNLPDKRQNFEPVSFAVAQNNGEPIKFIENGKSDYKIVIPAEATYVEEYAAEELRDFLESSTSCRLSVITDSGLIHDNSKSYLSVGNTSLLRAQTDIIIDYETMGERTPSIHTKDRTVYMAGASDYGTLFSVYKFLEYEIGFESFASDYVYYEPHASLPLYNFNYEYIPTVTGPVNLGIMSMDPAANPNAIKEAARMYMWGSYKGGVGFNGNLFAPNSWCHTTFLILPPEEYQSAHPDWYGNDQLCYSNEEMTQEYIKQLSKRLENSDAPYAMIGGSDLRSSCGCEECSESYRKYGGGGGILTQFCNKVAEGIKEILPGNDTLIVGLAYYAYSQPPVIQNEDGSYSPIDKTVICRPDVGMLYAPIDACYSHPFGEDACENNVVATEHFKGWSACSEIMFTYLYMTDFSDLMGYFNNWDAMVNSAAFFKEINLDFFFTQGDGWNYLNPFGELKSYLHSKSLWNPSYQTEELVDRFMNYYYEDGAVYMKEFYEVIRQQANVTAIKQGTACVGIYDQTMTSKYWSRDTYLKMLNILQNAFNAIERSSKTNAKKEVLTERVYREYMIMRYQEVSDYKQYYSEQEYTRIMAEVYEFFEKYGIKDYD